MPHTICRRFDTLFFNGKGCNASQRLVPSAKPAWNMFWSTAVAKRSLALTYAATSVQLAACSNLLAPSWEINQSAKKSILMTFFLERGKWHCH